MTRCEVKSDGSVTTKERVICMGLFDIDDEKLKAFYHRAWLEANRGFVDPRKYPYLDHAIIQYARKYGCTYDQALILAKTGKKMF